MTAALSVRALTGETLVRAFLLALDDAGIVRPEREVTFHRTRKWRFDFAWRAPKVALEMDGGVFSGGRHVRGQGFLDDMAKLNAATLLGWRVFRCTPDTLCDPATLHMVREALAQ